MVKTEDKSAGLRRVSALVQFLLLGLFAYMVVKAIITYMTPEVAWKPVELANTGAGTAAASQSAAARNFDFSFNPFHREQSASVVETGQDAPETTLNLRLVGINAVRDDSEAGTATLETADRKQNSYRVGEEIIDRVTLKAVFGDYVLLSQNGQTERLTVERDEDSGLRRAVPTKVQTTPTNAQLAAIAPLLDQDALAEFMKTTTIKAHHEDGKMLGYKVFFRGDNPGQAKYGLKGDDLITHVNGVDMRTGNAGYGELISSLREGEAVTLKLLRNGQNATVKVDL